ncbi:MAG: class I SAM-dependent methyltransferase [bacterium]
MNKKYAHNLITKTRDDYNLISEHFSRTRYYVWADIEKATESFALKNMNVLDLGCGNGRLYEFLTSKGARYTGLDLSPDLIKIAKNKYPKGDFVAGNLLKTPFEDGQFDVIYCIATLHHIPSKELRIEALKEISRILRPGGQIFFTNWYFWNKSKYLKQIRASFLSDNKLPLGDFFMPWKRSDTIVTTTRYFHAWTKTEMKQLLRKTGFTQIQTSGFKHKFWFLLGPNLTTTAIKKPR